MIRFARLLEEHPEIAFVGGFCQSPGLDLGHRLRDLVRRRGVLAVPLIVVAVGGAMLRWVTGPGKERRHRRHAAWLETRLHVTHDIHSPEVLDRITAAEADLGVIYGGPILRPDLFELPRFGTLGIHHGRLPDYRGKKTTFWALFNGEREAGVTIQRVDRGIDTGRVVRAASVPARGRSYRRVAWELEELGLDLYLDAVLGVREGRSRAVAVHGPRGPLYRDPRTRDLLGLAWRRLRRRFAAPVEAAAGGGPGDAAPGRAPRTALLLTESYHPMVGGGESQARSLARSLSSAGVPVTIITRRWDPVQPALALVDGIPVRRTGPSGPGHLKKWGLVFTLVPPILDSRQVNGVFLVCGFRVMGIPATILGRFLGLRVILKADSVGELSGAFFEPGLARFGLSVRSIPVRIPLALRNRLLRRADAFVAISSVIRNELLRHGVPPGRIHDIPNGVDTEAFRPVDPRTKAELRTALGLPAEARIAVYTGRLVSYKGLPALLRVWETVARRQPHAHLLLVGSGGEDIHNCEADLRSFVRDRALEHRVTFAGAVDRVADYLCASDLFVFPSENEAFGLAAVEAMACGLPVVSTRAGGLADFVSPENGAIPIEARDDDLLAALETVITDLALAAELGHAARLAACDRFSIHAVRNAYLDVISGSTEATA
jgi:glycosyltransferase involved in cell wall biosynthesis/folate-dependent phosphoribosylglycinamide formyltransferase PurN